ncbi:hypothetical protein ALC57_03946, partial [Trachymyrmex cornetzi]
YTPLHQKGKKGDHALVMMFQPFQGKWVQSLACFLSKGCASATVLHQLIVECIILVEQAGLHVDVITTDGATWNRSMWVKFGITEENVSCEHIVDPSRRLWFISDFPHLVKCLRNFIIKHTETWTPDGVIKLSHWYALLKSENPTGFNLKVVHKLTIDHIEPRYYQKMNTICIAIIFKEMFLLKLFFGMMRSCCGSNDHPDSTLFIQIYRLVSTYSLVKPPKGSNISGGEILEVLLKIKDIMDITERNTQRDAQIDTILDRAINVEVISEAASIIEDHDYFTCTTSEYVVAYIAAGYVARKTSRFACFYIGQKRVLCKNCIATLQLSSSELVPKSYKLISLKSKGNLINPSVNLLILISILEKATLNILNSNELNANTLFEITKILENVRSLPLVGCCKHDMVLTHGVIRFYLTTRIYFICKQENKNNNMQNQRTRERRKAAKLTSCKEIKKTEVKSNEVKAINKRKNEERNVIRNKRKRIDVIQNNKM